MTAEPKFEKVRGANYCDHYAYDAIRCLRCDARRIDVPATPQPTVEVVKVDTQPKDFSRGSYSSGRYFSRRPDPVRARLYVWPENESVLENLVVGRFTRPVKLLRAALPAILEATGLPAKTKARWSQYAGCSCPCSPGFVLDAKPGFDIHATVRYAAVDLTREQQFRADVRFAQVSADPTLALLTGGA